MEYGAREYLLGIREQRLQYRDDGRRLYGREQTPQRLLAQIAERSSTAKGLQGVLLTA
jgi:hypothetical protein